MIRALAHRVFFAAAVCLAAPFAKAETQLTFCYDPYPPYTLGSGERPQGGLKVDLLEAVVARIEGVSADVILLPWARCQDRARSGAVDGILPLFYSAEREDYLAFSDATFEQTSALWYHVDALQDAEAWTGDYDDISTLRLGLLNGSVIDPEMEAAFMQHQPILRANSVQSLFDMLRFDRIDLVGIDAKVGEYHLHQAGLKDEVRALPVMIAPRSAHFGLSRASGADAYLEAFNEALATLRSEGALNRIYDGGW